jgi:hypothetical protein
LALTGGAGRLVSRSAIEGRPARSQIFSGWTEAELPRSMNAAYSRLELVGDSRSKLNRMTRQRGAEGTLRACIPSCSQLARSPPQVIRG